MSKEIIDAPRKDIVLTKAQTEYVQAGNQFTFNWLNVVNEKQNGDWFVSPLSIQFVLCMLANGADGFALGEICNVLCYGRDDYGSVNDYIKSIMSQLAVLDPNTEINIANLILADARDPFIPSYKSQITSTFNATAHEMSFSQASAVVAWVNQWASGNTKGMITDIISEKDLGSNTRSVIGNTVYFKGRWKQRFNKNSTKDKSFTLENGTKKTVKMMSQTSDFLCGQTSVFKQLSLPYGNESFQMVILLPSDGKSIRDVIAALSDAGFPETKQKLADVWLPKFESHTPKFEIKDYLVSMGMDPLTLEGENFRGIQPDIETINILHSARIAVDESGSEAGAATVATGMATGMPFQFHADHPFLYLIREVSTGAILFAGKYGAE